MEKVNTNGKMLRWAREFYNLSIPEVAIRMKKTEKDIENWENDLDHPTYAQLEKLAYEIYKKPLAVFFFSEVPTNIKNVKNNFRTITQQIYNEIPNSVLKIINNARVMQLNLEELDVVSEYYSTREKIKKCKNMSELRNLLGVPIDVQKSKKNSEEMFNMWREAFQKIGIFIFKDAFKDNNYSGFCIDDDRYPGIYINNTMSFSRQIFTLFHELCHLIAETSGIDTVTDDYLTLLNKKSLDIEKKCNKFAEEFLLNDENFKIECKKIEEESSSFDMLTQKLSSLYCVSRDVLLYKMFDENMIEKDLFFEKIKQYMSENNRRKKGEQREGGSYYNTQASYLGKKYLNAVFEKYYSGSIDMFKVAEYLNTSYKVAVKMEARFGDGV